MALDELVIMSWAGGWGRSLQKAVSEPFSQLTGIPVRHDVNIGLKLPASLTDALHAHAAPPYDLIWSNGVPAMRMAQAGYCENLDEAEFPSLTQLSSRAKPAGFADWPLVMAYVVYYVLAYRDAAVPHVPESWDVLMEPRHQGKVALYPGGNGFYPIAQRLGGGDVNTIPEDMSACWQYCKRLKAQLGQLDYSIGMGQHIAQGTLNLCFRALTNALAFREEGLDVSWVAPREGISDTVDALWVPKHVPKERQEWAKRYINFALSQPVQEQWCTLLGAMPMHKAAKIPNIFLTHPSMPKAAEDLTGVLHIPEQVKVEHEAAWENTFTSLVT